jgi:hypothetical protein
MSEEDVRIKIHTDYTEATEANREINALRENARNAGQDSARPGEQDWSSKAADMREELDLMREKIRLTRYQTSVNASSLKAASKEFNDQRETTAAHTAIRWRRLFLITESIFATQ